LYATERSPPRTFFPLRAVIHLSPSFPYAIPTTLTHLYLEVPKPLAFFPLVDILCGSLFLDITGELGSHAPASGSPRLVPTPPPCAACFVRLLFPPTLHRIRYPPSPDGPSLVASILIFFFYPQDWRSRLRLVPPSPPLSGDSLNFPSVNDHLCSTGLRLPSLEFSFQNEPISALHPFSRRDLGYSRGSSAC